MLNSPIRFKPGTLWDTIVERAQSALACGALQPIATENRTVVDGGVHFEIRVVSSLARKVAKGLGRWPTKTMAQGATNPFLPYEKELFVADISDSHLCLLNKYNVIDHHVLIVTRAFEPQESLLTRRDFEALWSCMAEFDALGFYNSGPNAGASQPHKHLQLVPLPLTSTTSDIATSVLFGSPTTAGEPTRVASLPFVHAFAWLDPLQTATPATRAANSYGLYLKLLRAVDMDAVGTQPEPYNLLITRRFMLLVPRRLERFETVAVNALGFAGSFFVARQESLDVIVRIGPMALLRQVAYPINASE